MKSAPRPISPCGPAAAPIALILAALAAPTCAHAGAWTQDPGSLYARLTYAGITSGTRFDAVGERVGLEPRFTFGAPDGATEYRGREARVYVEYGLIERFTTYGSVTWKRVVTDEPVVKSTNSGFGDLILGGRYRVLRGRVPLSLASELKIPTGYSRESTPSLGAGDLAHTLRGLVGASWGWLYTTADAGWTRRTKGYPNEYVYSAEVGGTLPFSLSWRSVVRGVRSTAQKGMPIGGALFDPERASSRLLTLDGVLGIPIFPGLHLESGVSHVLDGRNALAGNTLEVGFAWSGNLAHAP
ncbi:MAG: hypothetical protein E6K77_04945 [Candidatus Eisenbacteria bacterium]|uniref:Transporter n=1 Tax=Eiseniibacteriota bacterium TaxID=2212470 RepID=A0A538TIZ7_UNCEI|nr:MAG: hypothetical protein E6K77_04945 [Candidatus Eisenbacteria bacterium]